MAKPTPEQQHKDHNQIKALLAVLTFFISISSFFAVRSINAFDTKLDSHGDKIEKVLIEQGKQRTELDQINKKLK